MQHNNYYNMDYLDIEIISNLINSYPDTVDDINITLNNNVDYDNIELDELDMQIILDLQNMNNDIIIIDYSNYNYYYF